MKLKKILAILLAAVTVMTVLPMTAVSAFAAESGTAEKNITLGTSALQGGQKSSVYYGTYKQSSDGKGGYNTDPIKWRVLSNTDGKLFLLSDQNLEVFEYHKESEDVTWETSTMRSWLNGLANNKGNGENAIDYTNDSFLDTAFSASEQSAIADTTVVNNDNSKYQTVGGNDTTDKVFLLSITEVQNTAYGFTHNIQATDTRKSINTAYVAGGGKTDIRNMSNAGLSDSWWLRSPGSTQSEAAYVTGSGYLSASGVFVSSNCRAVRPAFNLNLSAVLFTSAAKGGKSAFSATTDLAGSDGYKLTLLDASRSVFSAEILKTSDKTFVSYKGAATGENEYITAMIVNASGEVTYYGSLKNIADSSEASGTFEIDLYGKLNNGDKLYILNEQYNGDYKTDYASALNEVTVPSDMNAYNVSFNTNGGTGTMNDAAAKRGEDYTLPECGFTCVGYSFKGWSRTADGEIIDTASIRISNDTTLYAIWISNSDLIAELDKAIQNLDTAMKDGDKDLADEIEALTNTLNSAKQALETADTANKEYLEDKITAAQNTLQAAIDKVADDLSQAITDLNKAIGSGDTELSDKITALTNTLNSAKQALEAADTDSKEYLEGKIAAAQNMLQAAIEKAAKDLANARSELDEKDAELQTFITVVCVISCVSLCGSGAFVIWFFVGKKKNLK